MWQRRAPSGAMLPRRCVAAPMLDRLSRPTRAGQTGGGAWQRSVRVPPQEGARTMDVGIPRELKDHEYRVAITPAGVRALSDAEHRVLVERGAGEGSSFFFFSSRRRHTSCGRDWSSDVCSSDLKM